MELQFIIYVDGLNWEAELIECLYDHFPGELIQERGAVTIGRFGNNYWELINNDDADPVKAADPNNGFLYYRFMMTFVPCSDITVEAQIDLAKRIRDRLLQQEWQVAIGTDFEDLL